MEILVQIPGFFYYKVFPGWVLYIDLFATDWEAVDWVY